MHLVYCKECGQNMTANCANGSTMFRIETSKIKTLYIYKRTLYAVTSVSRDWPIFEQHVNGRQQSNWLKHMCIYCQYYERSRLQYYYCTLTFIIIISQLHKLCEISLNLPTKWKQLRRIRRRHIRSNNFRRKQSRDECR